jgi:hypothetical protein
MISGLRFVIHVFVSVTFFPFFKTSASGSDVYVVAFVSSALAALGAVGVPDGPLRVESI